MLAVAGSAGISDGQAVTRCDSPRVSVATSSAPAMNGLKETSGSLDPSRNEFQSHFNQPVKSYNKGYDFPGTISHHFNTITVSNPGPGSTPVRMNDVNP